VRSAAQPGAQFVQLHLWQMAAAEPVVMQPRTMIAGSSEPGRHRGVAMPNDACGSGNIQPLSQGSQHLAHTLRSRLEAIERRVQAGTEGGSAGLTAEGLDPLMPAVRTITYYGMDVGIRDVIVMAPAVGTREALCINALGRTPTTFYLTPGLDR
jgi:hypothetical protein